MASAFPAAVNSGTEAEAAHRYPGVPALGSYQQVEAIGVRHLLTDHLPTPARDIVVLGIKLRFVDRHILNVVYVAAVHAHPPPLVLAVKTPSTPCFPPGQTIVSSNLPSLRVAWRAALVPLSISILKFENPRSGC